MRMLRRDSTGIDLREGSNEARLTPNVEERVVAEDCPINISHYTFSVNSSMGKADLNVLASYFRRFFFRFVLRLAIFGAANTRRSPSLKCSIACSGSSALTSTTAPLLRE